MTTAPATILRLPHSETDRLGFLDLGRGVAALLVLLAHGVAACVPAYVGWAANRVEFGRVGVAIFLIISGFIIPVSLEKGGSLKTFWVRRIFRLYPAYWLCIAAAFAYAALGGWPPLAVSLADASAWLVNLTMCQGFVNEPDVVGVFWTLRLELLIYFACSLLFVFGLLRHVGWGVGMASVVVYAALGVGCPIVTGTPFNLSDEPFLYLAPLMGLVAQRYWAGHIGPRRFYAYVFGQAAALVIAWAANRHMPHEVGLRVTLCNWGLAYACFLALLEARRLPMPAIGRWLGQISYSVYLFHPLLLLVLLPLNGSLLVFLPALVGSTLLVSGLVYYGVEAPGIALGRWLTRRRATPENVAPAAKAA